MKKKSVNLITAVGVLVVLSGAYVGVKTYVAKQDAKEEESSEEDTKEVVSIASKDIQSIKFVIDKKEVTFEKDGDSWAKSDESAFPVDQDKVDTLAGVFNSVTAQRTLENVEDPAEYELDSPENTITVTTTNGETTVIQVGMENDSTSQEYIDLNNDSSTVYVVSNSTFKPFEGTLYDFAKSGTFPTVDSSTVSKIAVDGKDSSYVVEKDENNFWNVTSDGETEKADSAKATSLASTLSSMAYSSYVNYNCQEDELSQYGLDKPYGEITVDYQEAESTATEETDEEATDAAETEKTTSEEETTGDNEETDSEDTESEPVMIDKQLVIQIGDQSSDGDRYVRVNDSNEIYTISEDSLDGFLGKTSADFWDMTVSYLSVNNLEKLTVKYGGTDYDINVSRETSEEDESSSSTTTLSYDLNGKDLDSTTFTTFYNKLINMTAQKRLTDKFESNTDPEMTVKFTDVDGNTMSVSYYTYDTNYYAAVKDDGKVYLVNKMTVKEMFTAFTTVSGENSTELTTGDTETDTTENEGSETNTDSGNSDEEEPETED